MYQPSSSRSGRAGRGPHSIGPSCREDRDYRDPGQGAPPGRCGLRPDGRRRGASKPGQSGPSRGKWEGPILKRLSPSATRCQSRAYCRTMPHEDQRRSF